MKKRTIYTNQSQELLHLFGEGHGDVVEKLTYGQDVCHG
jgi:hypothetical protein